MIAMAGETNRKVFFNERSLNLPEGYRIISGGIPTIEDINRNVDDVNDLIKRLMLLIRKERINEGTNTLYFIDGANLFSTPVLPTLFEDVDLRMKGWGTEGKINPFNEVYDVSLHHFGITV